MIAATLVLAGCGGVELPPCDAQERQAQAARVDTLPAGLRDSITRAFSEQPRIREVAIEQSGCHLRAAIRVDSFATVRYGSTQGFALIRALKTNAPGETRPLVEEPASQAGAGIYDYTVTIERREEEAETPAPGEQSGTPWVRLSKPYHDRRVTVRR